jgi:hypothetical protein
MRYLLYLIAFLFVLSITVFPAYGAATTTPVSDLTNSQVWFHGTADPLGTIGWFAWGGFSGGPYYWSTPNQTVVGGAAFQDYQYGPPMLTCSTYYVVACDDTGCDPSEIRWTTPAPRMLNITHYGAGVITIMRSGWNVTQTFDVIIHPYTSTVTAPVTWFLLFFFIFVGLWLRQKDTLLPMMLAMVSGAVIWGSAALGVLPPVMMDIGQGLFIASLAGYAFSLFTK